MSLSLKPVNKENWRQVAALELAEGQQGFVAPNWYSMLEAIFEEVDYIRSVAIIADNILVGYALYGMFSDDSPEEFWLARLMIAAEHQGKGYGRRAVALILAELQTHDPRKTICLSIEPENAVARKLYESMGFVHEGRIEHNELVFEYRPESA